MKTAFRTVLVALVVVGAVSGSVVHCLQSLVQAQPPQIEDRVDNTIRERGTVESVRSVDLRCEVEGESTILSIVPEGSHVRKGDLLVELDAARIHELLAEAKINAVMSEAQLFQSQEEFESLKQDGAATLEFAKKSLEVAMLSKQRVLSDAGELDCELKAIESELTIAQARLKAAEELISRSQDLRGGKTLEDLRLIVVEASETVKVAEARKKLLEQYDRPYRSALLELAVAEEQMQLGRQRNEFGRALRLAEMEVQAKKMALAQQRGQLEKVEQQLELCNIHAPQAGVVLYAVPSVTRTDRAAVIEEGAQIRERQLLIRLPDMSNLQLKLQVNESHIARVRPGQVARILVDAFPDKTLHGEVTRVSEFPVPASRLNSDVKQYAVLVAIVGPADFLQIGLTATVEIAAQ